MSPFAHRAFLAIGLCLATLLAGTGGGSASPATVLRASNVLTARPAHGVAIWAAVQQTSMVLGLSMGAKRVLDVISTENQPVKGGQPLTLKVDHAQSLYVADVSGGKAGVIQEYSSNGTFARAYVPTCPVANCSKFTGSLADSVVDSAHVFAIMKQMQYNVGSQTTSFSGYEYWPNGNPSTQPIFVPIPSDCSIVCFMDAGDEDASGNLWVRDYGGGGYGVAEITNPATSPSFIQMLSLESFTINQGDIAGFYISNGGTVLNVGDSTHRIYQYALPLTFGAHPFNTLTPCSQGCDPHGFGFNANDTLVVAGDGSTGRYASSSDGLLDIGHVAKNRWKQVGNPEFTAPISSAVYTPSDK